MKHRLPPVHAVLLALGAMASGCTGEAEREPATIILTGGRVFLADAAETEHEAIAILGERVVDVGSAEVLARWRGPRTRVIDLRGRLVTPGMNDAHLHFESGGVSLLQVGLLGASSLAEIEERLGQAVVAAEPGEWIVGRGWDHTLLPDTELGPGGWPTRQALDRVAPDNPVYLSRVDGHTGWANSVALQLAGVDASTPDPFGGEIVRDPATGLPTGILKENATLLVRQIVPDVTEAQLIRGIDAALDLARRTGVTSVQTSASPAGIRRYQELANGGDLSVRIYAWRALDRANIGAYESTGIQQAFGNPWLRLGMMKLYSDGTLGSRTAWMLEPFADDPSTSGLPVAPVDSMRALIAAADSAGLQVIVHAIGDGANRKILDIFEELRTSGPDRPRRHRIEHAQVVDAADIPRFAALGVIASMQPTHATSDMRWIAERIGEDRAAEGAYAWRSLLDAGARIAFGTDFSVEPMDP